jgi:hypothetical protein
MALKVGPDGDLWLVTSSIDHGHRVRAERPSRPGSRGLGGFSRLLIGSVSSQVAHHAPCPIVVVPTRSQAGGEV